MDDVTRLFRALVKHLAEHDPRRLSAPFQISELYQSLIPYRLFKSELQFGSIDDYEMAILKLLAGNRQLVRLDPDDVQEVLRAEADAVVPDTGAFRDFAGARIILQADAVRGVLDEQSAYAPPDAEPDPSHDIFPDDPGPPEFESAPDIAPEPPTIVESAPTDPQPPTEAPDTAYEVPAAPIPTDLNPQSVPVAENRSSALVFEPVEPPVACPECQRSLPPDRSVSFCPFCGTLVSPGTCVRCGDAIEPTWRFCGSCGQPAS